MTALLDAVLEEEVLDHETEEVMSPNLHQRTLIAMCQDREVDEVIAVVAEDDPVNDANGQTETQTDRKWPMVDPERLLKS